MQTREESPEFFVELVVRVSYVQKMKAVRQIMNFGEEDYKATYIGTEILLPSSECLWGL